jgi:hypothetical protein
VLVSAHFGQPRATVATLGQIVGTQIPFELGLALLLGVEGMVFVASDTAQPIDVFVTGTVDHPDLVYVLTPQPAERFRSTLSNRFRLVRQEGLGERLDPQNAGPRANVRGTRCAIVGVPGALPQRLVCANRLEALEHAGRFAAYESQRLHDEHGDLLVDVDGATARNTLTPVLTRAIDENTQSLAANAAEERRRHDREPDLGDPEAALSGLAGMARSAVRELDDVRHLTVRGAVAADGVTVESDLTLDANGHGMLVRDANSRVGVDPSHPLVNRLAPDSLAAFSTRTQTQDRAALVDSVVQSVVGVLGSRIGDPDVARRDVNALFAQLGDETDLGVAREPEGGFEVTAAFAQRDDGSAARAALANLARAPWLRAARFGDVGVTVSFAHDVLTLRTQETRHAANPRAGSRVAPVAAGTETAAPEPPRTVALSVVGNVLVAVIGTHVDTTLAAIASRASGPAPAVLNGTRGSFVGAVDLGPMLSGMADDEHPIARFDYAAERRGDDLVGHGRVVVPPSVVRAGLRNALPGR